MAKIMNQLDLLTTHVMGGGRESVNAIASASDMPFDGEPYDVGYNE